MLNPFDAEAQLEGIGKLYPVLRIIDEEGEIVDDTLYPDISDDELVELMKRMVWGRIYDTRVTNLNRQGVLGNYAPSGGQEASQLASQFALEPEDYLLPTYRDIPPLVMHGLPLHKAFLWYKGHVEGNLFPEGLNAMPPQVIIGAQIVQAAGLGLSFKLRKENRVVLTYIGDGGSSQGDFYEGLNMAGSFDAKAIFIVQNNGFGISTPREVQTRAGTLVQKAAAAGVFGIQVDGMDPLAVYSAVKFARKYATEGRGPVLIETLTYRYGPHTMSDDPARYRDDEELTAWEKKDQLIRMRKFLQKKGLWDDGIESQTEEQVRIEIKEALEKVRQTPGQTVDGFIDNMYSVKPELYKRQQESHAGRRHS